MTEGAGEQDLHRENHHHQNLDLVSLYEQECLWEKSMCTMGVGYESESGAGVVAPRLGGWEARSKSRSTKRQVLRQRLSARHWVHLHTQHKLQTGVPHSWVIWKCVQWGYGSGGRYPDFLIEWIYYWTELKKIKIFESILEVNLLGKKYWIIYFNTIFMKKSYTE